MSTTDDDETMHPLDAKAKALMDALPDEHKMLMHTTFPADWKRFGPGFYLLRHVPRQKREGEPEPFIMQYLPLELIEFVFVNAAMMHKSDPGTDVNLVVVDENYEAMGCARSKASAEWPEPDTN